VYKRNLNVLYHAHVQSNMLVIIVKLGCWNNEITYITDSNFFRVDELTELKILLFV